MAIDNYSEANFQQIDKFLKAKGLNCNARAGLIGNLYKESRLYPNNLQNSYEGKAPYYWNDNSYTTAVDNGSYKEFDTDRHGYGLCQWTSAGRKAGYHNKAIEMKKSIGDMSVALEWLWIELNSSSYKKQVLPVLMEGNSVDECARIVMTKFEKPANQSEANQLVRVAIAQEFYDKYYASSAEVSKPVEEKVVTDSNTEFGNTYVTYKVIAGDTITKIAKKFNTTKEALCELNPSVKLHPNLIKVGDIINIYAKEEDVTTPTVILTNIKTESAESYNKSLSKSYTTTSNLNLRSGAGISKTKIAVIPKGQSVRCYGYYTSSLGVKWLLVQTTIDKKKYTGFCSSLYLK